jgi:hypothetical protein
VSEHANEKFQQAIEHVEQTPQVAPSGAPTASLGFAGGSVSPSLARLARSDAEVQRVAVLTSLQAGYGNAHVLRLLRQAADAGGEPPAEGAAAGEGGIVTEVETFEPEEMHVLPDEHMHVATVGGDGFTDGGQTGTVPHGGDDGHDHSAQPQAFTDGGNTGTVIWAGGGGAGAHGNEAVGSVQSQVAPEYQGKANPDTKDADAWVKPGTGKVSVTRSWVGIGSGDQGNGWFVTPAGATRINAHELLHVASTKGHYNTHLKPLEERVADKTLGMGVAATPELAIAHLKTVIKWPESITAFQNADKADNKPMGPVDTNDLASGTYPVDSGPGTVGGKNYQHRLRTPSEPDPT